MLSIRKLSQDISENTCKWIPIPSLDKEWNDIDVYKYFKLTKEEIKLVKEIKISGYKDIIKKEINGNIDSTSEIEINVKLKPKKSNKSKTIVV